MERLQNDFENCAVGLKNGMCCLMSTCAIM
jgi:hypothetical protein